MTKLYDELKTLAEAEVGDPLLAWFLREHLPAILSALKNQEPQWIVNDLGELGVRIGERFFFLYKGGNIEYGETSKDGIAHHDDGKPMYWRIVGKREFGETCQPLERFRRRWPDLYLEPVVYTPGLSDGTPEDGEWKPLPAAQSQEDRHG